MFDAIRHAFGPTLGMLIAPTTILQTNTATISQLHLPLGNTIEVVAIG